MALYKLVKESGLS